MRRLLIRPGAIGDIILSLPALEQSRAKYTEVWAPRAVLPLIQFADQTRALADSGLDWVGVVQDYRAAPALSRLAEFDSIYSWYGANHPEFREAVRDLPFTFLPALPPPSGVPRISVPHVERTNRLVIHPFASAPAKRWPLEEFQDVAKEFQDVAWCRGPEEKLDGAACFDNLYALACWLGEAGAYLGNDSGIAHLAAAVGTPVVSIFLTTDAAVWTPRGTNVTVLHRPSRDSVVSALRCLVR